MLYCTRVTWTLGRQVKCHGYSTWNDMENLLRKRVMMLGQFVKTKYPVALARRYEYYWLGNSTISFSYMKNMTTATPDNTTS